MALQRKFLSALGIEPEKIDEIITAHSETVEALKKERDDMEIELKKYKEDADKLPGVQKELNELKVKVDADAKEREGKDYDALKKEFDDYKAEQERKALRGKKEAAYTEILKDAGVPEKHWAKILKYSDVDGVELDDKGKITTAKDVLKSIKEEWGDHIPQTRTQGAQTETPPQGRSGGTKMTLEQIDAIEDTAARQKAMSENPELFGLA